LIAHLKIYAFPLLFEIESKAINEKACMLRLSLSSRNLDFKTLTFPAAAMVEMERVAESVISDADSGKKRRLIGGLREALRGW
jgi:hypothetical protein